MPRYKVLTSVAHNIGHSFTSLTNYAGDDYVMGHILTFARRTGCDTLTIDLIKGEGSPPELLAEPLADVPSRYGKWLWHLVESQGSDRSCVHDATLTLRYGIATQRPWRGDSQFMESPYTCDIRITDSRGKQYLAHFEGWWFPERIDRTTRRVLK